MFIVNYLRSAEEDDMRQIAWLILLGVVCTVNYPADCTIVNTRYVNDDAHFKAEVECSYGINGIDGRSHYFIKINRNKSMDKTVRVDYLPSATLTDSITMTCK